jgi:4-hydroxy-tetrahydrodipicolinate synthase
MVRACGSQGGVYSACDNMLYPTYVAGAVGTIAAIATVAPALCLEQWEAWQKRDHETARRIHDLLGPIVAAYLERPFPGKVKYACELQGRPMGMARRPTTGPDGQQKEAIRRTLKGAGLL